MNGCVFCKIISGEIPSVKIYESGRVLAFLDVNPIERGHTLVIPKCHWASMDAAPLDDAAAAEVFGETTRVVWALTRAVRVFASGVSVLQANGASAGQTVPHLHFHVIPRYGAAAAPQWVSGAAAYAADAERDGCAAEIRAALAGIMQVPAPGANKLTTQ